MCVCAELDVTTGRVFDAKADGRFVPGTVAIPLGSPMPQDIMYMCVWLVD